jgi:hypothetical protein
VGHLNAGLSIDWTTRILFYQHYLSVIRSSTSMYRTYISIPCHGMQIAIWTVPAKVCVAASPVSQRRDVVSHSQMCIRTAIMHPKHRTCRTPGRRHVKYVGSGTCLPCSPPITIRQQGNQGTRDFK